MASSGPARAADSGAPNTERRHLANVRQLTFGGQNAEAYFSTDGSKLIFQSTRPPYDCDQIFMMNSDGSDIQLLSTGKGRTTCAFFFPDGKRFIYASTHLKGDACPPKPDRSKGYVWSLYDFDIFSANIEGTGLKQLTDGPGYNAEGCISPDGQKIVFTSLRNGDLDLYLMNADGSEVKRLTERLGFDGGPFFSWDGKYIVYRSYYPETPAEIAEYKDVTARKLMKPVRAEIFFMKADGSDKIQVTKTGDANWSPFMHPDNRRIIFSSNMHQKGSGSFSLYLVNTNGTGLERVTYGAHFDSFPMFSKDGKKLVWCSTRNAREPGEYNIFMADWID
jgi:Tol biopolymer transport system component